MDPETTAGTSSMMALRAHQRGGPEQLSYERAPRPTPGAGEIRVAVRAAAITFAELTWPETWESDGVDRTPIIPAHEFAGTVDEVGSGVDDLSVGDPVFGLVPFDRDGAAADFVVLPANTVTRKAPTVDDIDAAAAVLPVLTAWEALRDHVGLAPGQRLLVRGGTGAVGGFLTQFAHETGAEVTVTVSSASAEAYAKRLGADHVIVATDLEPGRLVGFDAAIDAVGDELPEWIYAAVRRGGRAHRTPAASRPGPGESVRRGGHLLHRQHTSRQAGGAGCPVGATAHRRGDRADVPPGRRPGRL